MRVIATIGPNSMSKKVLYELINNGADAIRLNFSHFYEEQFTNILEDARSINSNISIIADLCGKKVRVYEKINNIYKVYSSEIVYFCSEDVYELMKNSTDERVKLIPLTLKSKIIEQNDIKSISMKDGTMNFEIIDKDKVFLKARAINNGIVRGGKGCNLIGVNFGKETLSDKDKLHIKWILNNNIETIWQSFVESCDEIDSIRSFIKDECKYKEPIKIFSKIETINGIENYKEILESSEGIIIARGDMIPECGIINSVNKEFELINSLKGMIKEKELIIATHLLDNMKYGNIASITEVESIYSFIKLGVTGFLLAGETSVGKNPVETVNFLRKLINSYMD